MTISNKRKTPIRRVRKKQPKPSKGYAVDWAEELNKLKLLPRVNEIIINTGKLLDKLDDVNNTTDYNIQSVLAIANHGLEEVLYIVDSTEDFVVDKQHLNDKLSPTDWYKTINLNLFKRFNRAS